MGQRFHKIRGGTLEQAYALARKRYGEHAVVINTAQVSVKGVLGLLGAKEVEITASVPEATPRPSPRKTSAVERKYAAGAQKTADPEMNETVQYFEKIVQDAQERMRGNAPSQSSSGAGQGAAVRQGAPSPVVPFPKPKADPTLSTDRLQREMQDMREMIQVIYSESPGAGLPAEFAPHYRTLIEQGNSRTVSAALIGAVVNNSDLSMIRDPRVFTERLKLEIRKTVRVTGGIGLTGGQCRVVAVCGATGVGKTTNLAKIAAQFSVRERARVAMVTTDTYRVGASEQLRVYANIIGVPLKVVNEAKEMGQALKEFHDYDLLLVDTAGGSQFNLEQIHDLQRMLHAAQPHETLLMLSANTQLEDLRNIAQSFCAVNPTSLVFTKLDETRRYGALFSILM
jgi:flagellar biosynthesis protein FlhF